MITATTFKARVRVLRAGPHIAPAQLIADDPVPMLADKAMGAAYTYAGWKARQKAETPLQDTIPA